MTPQQHLDGRTDSQKLAVIEDAVARIELRLFGRDGNRGIVDELDIRITKLENWRWWVVGIAIGLGAASGAGLSHLMGK